MAEGDFKEKPADPPGTWPLFPELEEPAPGSAWQPFTPSGVARFASAGLGRLCLVHLIVALLATAAVIWFLLVAWLPEVRKAIAALPEEGAIVGQQLRSTRTSPEPLAAGPFLGFAIDLDQRSQAYSRSDIYVKFHRHHLRVYSFAGYVELGYPRGWTIQFNRVDLEPRWGAWRPFVLSAVGLTVLMGLLTIWTVLAILYTPAVWVVARLAGRGCTLGGCWRLAGASLMPGAVLLVLGMLLYGLGWMNLVSFCVLAVLHFVPGWVYLILSPTCLPHRSPAAGPTSNPFIKNAQAGLDRRKPGPFG